MNYQLDQERNNQAASIEMAPIEEQQVEQEVDQSVEPEQEEVAPLPAPEPAQAKNFRQLKEQKQNVERERDELARKLAELEASQQPEEDYEFNLGADELAEGKHLRKVDSKIKRLEQQLQQYQQQTSLSAIELKLKSKYPDIDQIVSQENLELLQETYPEISSTLGSTTDLYAKAVSAYTLIKKLGIAQADNFLQDREKAIKNSAKPRPLASVSPQQGDSPLSRANAFANGLTDELKAQLQKEMVAARKAM